MLGDLEDCVRSFGACAIKIHPALNAVFPDDDGYLPIYEFAQAVEIPVISHGGGNSEMLYESAIEYTAPERFLPVLERFGSLRLVVAHLAHPYVDRLVQMATSFPYLYTDLSYVLGADLLDNTQLQQAVRSFGADRIMFGTDFPYFDPEGSLERLLGAGLSSQEIDAIAWGTASTLFQLT
jgi:predicted TIM-barrel fold metal-dependent hydrolase